MFADLKLYDVPRTVGAAVRQLRQRPVALVTVHGDGAILRAACREKGNLGILAVTALTSLDSADLGDLGYQTEVEDLVVARSRQAQEIGCYGVVASGREVRAVRRSLGWHLAVVVPGIRPRVGAPADDQKRTVDVEEAFENGADHIVVGRPIRTAPDPVRAAESIQERIRGLFPE